jgi:hypothetical protein
MRQFHLPPRFVTNYIPDCFGMDMAKEVSRPSVSELNQRMLT